MKSTIVIVTGYSGAGKSTVIKTLEDIGFFCVDNLPIPLLPAFFDYIIQEKQMRMPIALGIDVRTGNTIEQVVHLIAQYQDKVGNIQIFFLTTRTAELLKRFQETRRKHPLANNISLHDAIEQEGQLLQPLMNMASMVLDTGNFTIHQLRMLVQTTFAQKENDAPRLAVSLISFGFKYGVPQECNYVYDVRSLPNPHFVPPLQPLTGLDGEVKEYLFAQESVQEYWKKLEDFFYYSLQKSKEEGRFFVQVAIGCTGGKHRSVAFVEELAKQKIDGVTFLVAHRDVYRTLPH